MRAKRSMPFWSLLFVLLACSDSSVGPHRPSGFDARADVRPIDYYSWQWMQETVDYYNFNYGYGGACADAINTFWNNWNGTFTNSDWDYWGVTNNSTGAIMLNRDRLGFDYIPDIDTVFHEAWHAWYPNQDPATREASAASFAQGCLGQ
jgi:hypothetical protein